MPAIVSGIATCQCGSKMDVKSNNPKYVCARKGCGNWIPAQDLEAIFREQLRGFFLDPQEVKRHLSQGQGQLEAKAALLRALEAEEVRLQSEMDKIMRLYLDEEIRKEGFGERYRPLEDRRNQVRDEIPRLQGEVDFLRIAQTDADEFISEAEGLDDHFENLTAEEKRRIVEVSVQGGLRAGLTGSPRAEGMTAGARRTARRTLSPDQQARAEFEAIKREFGVGYKDVAELEHPGVRPGKFTYGKRRGALGYTDFSDKSIEIARGLGDEGEIVILRHEWKHSQQMWDRFRSVQKQLYNRSIVYRFRMESAAHGFAVMSPEAGSRYAWHMARQSIWSPESYMDVLGAVAGATYGGVKLVELTGRRDGP